MPAPISMLLPLSFALVAVDSPPQTCPEGTEPRRETYGGLFERFWCADAHNRSHGPYQSYLITGDGNRLAESGAYEAGSNHGTQRRYEIGVLVALTEYQHGERSGRWERWRHDGQALEFGTYAGDRPVGLWLEWTYHGNGRPKSETHRLLERVPRAMQLYDVRRVNHGPMRHWHDNGQLGFEGLFVRDQPQGTHRGWDHNGKLIWLDDYVAGKRHGRSERYRGEEVVLSQYADGQLHGPFYRAYRDQVIERGEYAHGQRHGEWHLPVWPRDVERVTFDNGWEAADLSCPDGTTAHIETTHERREHSCRLPDGRRHGGYVAWQRNGRIGLRGTYAFGGRQGQWHTSGRTSERWLNNVRLAAE